MKQDLRFEELEDILKLDDDDRLALMLHRSVYPTTSNMPKYRDAELWKKVDSKEFNRWKEGAIRFLKMLREELK